MKIGRPSHAFHIIYSTEILDASHNLLDVRTEASTMVPILINDLKPRVIILMVFARLLCIKSSKFMLTLYS